MRMSGSLVALTAALCMSSCIAVSKTEQPPGATNAQSKPAPTAQAQGAPGGGDHSKDDPEQKRRAAEVRVAFAEQRLKVAQLEVDNFKINAAKGIENVSTELELAKGRLDQITNIDQPSRRAQAELSLQYARDRAQEAAEELAQIELMYKDQDLNDKTAEFVVNRGRRNAERAKQSIAIQEKDFDALVKLTLPRELASTQLEVSKKADEVERAKRAAESGAIEKQIALMSAQKEVDDAHAELAKLGAGTQQ